MNQRSARALLAAALPAALLLFVTVGCRKNPPPQAAGPLTSTRPPVPVVTLSDADLRKAAVNEAGMIPVLEYHRIQPGTSVWDRSSDLFRSDLNTLYEEGYRPISLQEYLDNRITASLGTTPVILTFDDSDRTQVWYTNEGKLDPNCALGILKSFHDAHPDFPLRAVFFVNSPRSFEQPAMAAKKMQDMLARGLELGNHTMSHRALKKLSDAEVQREIAGCAEGIRKLAPAAVVDTLALPFGIAPKNRKLAREGEADGVRYKNRGVLLVGSNPAFAPGNARYDPFRIPRIQAYGGPLGSDYWLKYLQKHAYLRYVSDGDPQTVTIRSQDRKKIKEQTLAGARLRTY